MPRSVASDLDLHCMPRFQKWDVGLYGLKLVQLDGFHWDLQAFHELEKSIILVIQLFMEK